MERLRQDTKSRMLGLQAILRALDGADNLYQMATEAAKAELAQAIRNGHPNRVQDWVKEQQEINQSLGERSVRSLRDLASELQIRSYHKMKKAELLSAIVGARAKR